MSLSPSVDFSTRRLAHALRAKGIAPEALDGWLSKAEMEIAKEVYAEPIYLNAHLYIRHYGEES